MKNLYNFNNIQEDIRKKGYPLRFARQYKTGSKVYLQEVKQNAIDRRSEERN